MILADSIFPELDLLKVIRMALIHDFGEIHAGDIIPGDQISPETKHQLERDSLVQIFGSLPNGDIYITLWDEYESCASHEAQFVRQIDKLEMALQASVYEHQHLENLAEFFQSARAGISTPELQSILDELEALR